MCLKQFVAERDVVTVASITVASHTSVQSRRGRAELQTYAGAACAALTTTQIGPPCAEPASCAEPVSGAEAVFLLRRLRLSRSSRLACRA